MARRPVLRWAKLAVAGIAALGITTLGITTGASGDSLIDVHEFSGSVSVESRWFPKTAANTEQKDFGVNLIAEPELYLESADGTSLTLKGFYRYDSSDSVRSHADLRKAYLLFVGQIEDQEWELRLGVDRVYWGVAESRHLVDIVNQTDLVENPNEEVKLGQPMAHLTLSGEWGAAELFALPYHRPRTFPGRHGRLRSAIVVDNDRVMYESGAEEWRLDVAARYSHSVGLFDVGLSVFDGTSREPSLQPLCDPSACALVPFYEQIRQFGLDAQMTYEAWLLKLEAIRRMGAQNALQQDEDFTAFVAGGEYTFYSVFDTDIDLGLLAEWNRDGRRMRATNIFQNDVFVAARLAFNDFASTDLLIGVLEDVDTGSRSFNAQFNRRLSDSLTLNFEGTFFHNIAVGDADYATRRDNFVNIALTYSF